METNQVVAGGVRPAWHGFPGTSHLTPCGLGGKLGACYKDDSPGGHDDALSAGLSGRA